MNNKLIQVLLEFERKWVQIMRIHNTALVRIKEEAFLILKNGNDSFVKCFLKAMNLLILWQRSARSTYQSFFKWRTHNFSQKVNYNYLALLL